MEIGREGGREGGRDGWREEGGREGGREGGIDGGRREGGMEGELKESVSHSPNQSVTDPQFAASEPLRASQSVGRSVGLDDRQLPCPSRVCLIFNEAASTCLQGRITPAKLGHRRCNIRNSSQCAPACPHNLRRHTRSRCANSLGSDGRLNHYLFK